MKKSLLILMILSIFVYSKTVYAATYAKSGESNYSSFENKYKSGISKTQVSSKDTVTIYGFSNCETDKCTVSYANQSSSVSFEKVLSKSVTCSNGEKNIKYAIVGNGGAGFQSDNKDKYSGKVYWTVDVEVTCTNDSTSSSNDIVQIDTSTGGTSTGGTSTGGTSTGGTSTGGTSTGGYNSSTTTDNPEQGVETYYIVLGFIGIICYTFMSVVKKYNLFKKI